jgi:hypothetical protein
MIKEDCVHCTRDKTEGPKKELPWCDKYKWRLLRMDHPCDECVYYKKR